MGALGDLKGEIYMARILITGGAGFIGSHLVERLLKQDHEILCLDNYFTGSKGNLLHLRDHPRLEMIRHDVVNPIMLEVDQVYHLACPASPVHYQYNPVKTIKTNVLGTLNMLGLAKRVKARILLASTSEVYGDPQVHPQPEEYWGNVNPIGVRSCYDEGKRVAETLMMDYHRQNRVDTRLARIFNTFGPRMALNDGRVVSNFIVQALTGKDITIYGEGQQTRSFCYVTDLVEGLMRLMNRDVGSDPVNLGNPGEYTILEVAQKVLELINTTSAIIHQPLPPDDPGRRRPDISRARELLDWQPTVPLEAGLKETIPYFAQRLKQENLPVAASLNF
jgi:UDP-glucuronate decarboxylase